MIREFKLINEKGQEFNLMDKENYCFLNTPGGLGYSYATDYLQVGNTFIENIRKIQIGAISGELITEYYDNINNFANFVEQSEALKIAYKIPFEKKNPTTYYKDVNIQMLEKTEKDRTTGLLITPVIFDCKSLWYEENETIYEIKKKDREIRWNFRWNSRFTSYNSRNIVYNNTGHVEASIAVEMEGYLINPAVQVYKDKELIYELKLDMVIEEYEKLLYSSKDNDIFLYKQNQDGTYTSLFKNEYIDINNTNIFRLPKGMSEVRLVADNDVVKAKLIIYTYYKVV